MDLTFRIAQKEDKDTAVPLIYSSGPATFDYVFNHFRKGDALEFLGYVFASGMGEFGHQNHTVVETEGQVVGIGACYTGQDMATFTLAGARQILSFYGPLYGWSVIRRGLMVERVVQPPKRDIHYIAHLGIAPGLRSQGIGSRLIDHLLAQGKTAARTQAAIDVAADNGRAQALYERLGFVVTGRRPSRLSNQYGTVQDHIRLEKSID